MFHAERTQARTGLRNFLLNQKQRVLASSDPGWPPDRFSLGNRPRMLGQNDPIPTKSGRSCPQFWKAVIQVGRKDLHTSYMRPFSHELGLAVALPAMPAFAMPIMLRCRKLPRHWRHGRRKLVDLPTGRPYDHGFTSPVGQHRDEL